MQRALGDPPFRDEFKSPAWQQFFSKVALFIPKITIFEEALNPASVAANTKARQTFTVSGLTVNDIITVNPPSLTAGLDVIGFRVSAANTLELVFWNSTGAPIDEPSGTYLIFAIRK